MNYKTITMLVLCDSKTLRWLESQQQVLKISKYKPWAPACYNLTFRDPASNTKLILFQSNGSPARITELRSLSNILEGKRIEKI
jgi:hypothetical protein